MFCVFVCWQGGSCSPGWLLILLPGPPKYWDYKHVPPHPGFYRLFKEQFSVHSKIEGKVSFPKYLFPSPCTQPPFSNAHTIYSILMKGVTDMFRKDMGHFKEEGLVF